jgi:hypothetical protein
VALACFWNAEAMQKTLPTRPQRVVSWGLSAAVAAVLAACGGGAADQESGATQAAAPGAGAAITLQIDTAALPDDAAALLAQPAFHAAPVLLDAPDDTDVIDHAASARSWARVRAIPQGLEGLSTRRLTVQSLETARRMHALAATIPAADGTAAPMAGTGVVSTYTPAQIRAAYGLPALPATGSTLTAAQAAQQGAGQTIYIVDAMHDPNVAAELAAFNQKFGLPACTTKSIAVGTSLPLATASASGCELAVVFNTASGTLSSTAPAYDAGWATEIALDVQWAHATAPLARIVLIEAPDATLNGLLGSVKLANAMGPGVVSMSFGANEGSYTAAVDSAFTAARMTYLAATGDSGAGVSWPAVSPNVVAVGGTSLSYSGAGARSEVAWSGTGGGTSQFTATPSYQTATVPGLGTVAHRTVADVAFNADPATGQYVAVASPGSAVVQWLSVGGTSLSTPQWAGVVAVANALRAQTSKPALGAPHAVLYGQVASVPGTYAAAFADITRGTDGSCGTCSARTGYDPLTGLGTPNVANLLSLLASAGAAAVPPVVTPAAISGKVGTALSYSVSVSAPNPVSYALTNAPAGMVISAAGVLGWATPVAGTYAVTVTARDAKTALSGQGILTIAIAAPAAPVVGGGTVTGKAGTALSFTVSVTAPNPVSFSLSGAPSGMTVSATGVVNWANPVAGSYSVTVSARDSRTGLSGQGLYAVQIAASGPVITAAALTGVAGQALTGTISFSAPGTNSLSITISGAPAGMSFSVSGMSLKVSWAKPVAGSYSLKVQLVDSAGRSAAASVPVTITAK